MHKCNEKELRVCWSCKAPLPSPKRKVIQIIYCQPKTADSYLMALCDDGTLWETNSINDWEELVTPPGCELENEFDEKGEATFNDK